ncbi:DEAD/DEAH box helicase [Bdellovibrio sp. GT3]|uniref:DEAD/DEAH box helicase n=1 Tax=Bdellovibrio sp. GT3 TaxID=3136282 RepID=UPI0030F064DD
MKKYPVIQPAAILNMIQKETKAEYWRHRNEAEGILSEIVDSGSALGPLLFVKAPSFTTVLLRGDISYSRFRPGDRVDLRIQNSKSDASALLSENGIVKKIIYPSPGRIEVLVECKPFELDGVREVFLFQSSSEVFGKILRKRIAEKVSSEPAILGNGRYDLNDSGAKFRDLFEQLNPPQKEALRYLMENNLSGAIQGPPGTGKTHLLKTVVELAVNSGMKVCLASFTNAAVDNLLSRIVGSGVKFNWWRVGDITKVRWDLYSENVRENDFISTIFNEEINEAQLVGSTLHKLAFNKSVPKFDLLIVDEAGQVPIYFWPYIERIANRVVLVGDQHQLSPVLVAEHNDLPCDDVFSFIVGSDSPMLEIQYRMRSEIQAWSSEKFYRGKLTPSSSNADRDFFQGNPALYTDGFVVPKRFDGDGRGNSSIKEANYISDKVERLIKNGVDLSKVGVICPYRAQAGLVNSTLQTRFGVELASQVLIDTVERFQGQEREAIFLSFGSTSRNPTDLKFLANAKRLNVSVTRAKSRFYCLYDTQLWENSHNRVSADLNEFLRWVNFGKTTIRRAA